MARTAPAVFKNRGRARRPPRVTRALHPTLDAFTRELAAAFPRRLGEQTPHVLRIGGLDDAVIRAPREDEAATRRLGTAVQIR